MGDTIEHTTLSSTQGWLFESQNTDMATADEADNSEIATQTTEIRKIDKLSSLE